MNSNPNAAQKRWREKVRGLGSIISGGPAVIHHCVGRTAKHNKIHIGHWWIVPLTDKEHKDLHAGRLDTPQISRKEAEKYLFDRAVKRLGADDLPEGVYDAIMEYHR